MEKLKPKQIKIRSLVKFKDDDNEYIVQSVNIDKKMIWALRVNSLRQVKKKLSEIIKLDRKLVEII